MEKVLDVIADVFAVLKDFVTKKPLGVIAFVLAVLFVCGLFSGDPEPTYVVVDSPHVAANKIYDDSRDYLLNTNSRKFHYPSCGSGQRTKASNRMDFHGTREELIAMGYSPCGNCDP